MSDPFDVDAIARQLLASASLEDKKALVDELMSGQVTSILDRLELPLATLNRGHFEDFVQFDGLRLLLP